MNNIKWALDINNPSTWENIARPNVNVKPMEIKPILKDDYTRLKDIVSQVEDYHELDDILSMRVEDLLIYTREMVRG